MCKYYFITDIKNSTNYYSNKIKYYWNNSLLNLCKSKKDYSIYNELNLDLKKNLLKNDIDCDYILIYDN